MVKLAENHGCNLKVMKKLKEFSMVQIQNGHYEYADVLDTLRKKEVNDKV